MTWYVHWRMLLCVTLPRNLNKDLTYHFWTSHLLQGRFKPHQQSCFMDLFWGFLESFFIEELPDDLEIFLEKQRIRMHEVKSQLHITTSNALIFLEYRIKIWLFSHFICSLLYIVLSSIYILKNQNLRSISVELFVEHVGREKDRRKKRKKERKSTKQRGDDSNFFLYGKLEYRYELSRLSNNLVNQCNVLI